MTYEPTTHTPGAEPGPGNEQLDHAPYGHNVPMRVEMVPTGELLVDPDSVRIFSRRDLKAARRIIRRAGVRIPLGVDVENRVLVGEIILHVAREIGLEALPVVRIDDLDRLECQALSVAYGRRSQMDAGARTNRDGAESYATGPVKEGQRRGLWGSAAQTLR